MKSPIIATLALLLLSHLYVHADIQPTSQSSNQPSASAKLKTGVRFVMQEQFSQGSNLFTMLSPKKFCPVDFRSGLPGRRIPIPEGRILRMYSTLPEEGKPVPAPIYQGSIPLNVGNTVLGVVSRGQNGKFSIQYVDESNLKPGMVYFKNMTNKEIMINIADAPSSEQKQNIVKPGQEYVFGKATLIGTTTNYKGALLQQMEIKKQGKRWLPTGKFILTRFKNRALLYLILPDMTTQTAVLNKITIYDES